MDSYDWEYKEIKNLINENNNLINYNIINNNKENENNKLVEELQNHINYLESENERLFNENSLLIIKNNKFKQSLENKELEIKNLKNKVYNSSHNSNKNTEKSLENKLRMIKNDENWRNMSKNNSFISNNKKNIINNNENNNILELLNKDAIINLINKDKKKIKNNRNFKLIIKNNNDMINNEYKFNKNNFNFIDVSMNYDIYIENEDHDSLFKYIFKNLENDYNKLNYWIFSIGPSKSGKSKSIQGTHKIPSILPLYFKFIEKKNLFDKLYISFIEFSGLESEDLVESNYLKYNLKTIYNNNDKLYYYNAKNNERLRNILKNTLKMNTKKKSTFVINLCIDFKEYSKNIYFIDVSSLSEIDSNNSIIDQIKDIFFNKNNINNSYSDSQENSKFKDFINSNKKNDDKMFFIANMNLKSKPIDNYEFYKNFN